MKNIRVSDNRRFLQRKGGEPFFYLADTVWELFHRADREEAELLLADRAAKGFTAIQAVALAEIDGLQTPNVFGDRPLIDDDPTQPNENYFKFVDHVVRRANELGLTMALLPTWGDKWNPAWSKNSKVIFNVENARHYGRFLGLRYREADLIWITGGDRPVQNEEQLAIIRSMAEGLREGDGGAHLIGFHPLGGHSSSMFVHPEPWLDFHMIQSGHVRDRDNYAMIERDYGLLPVRPCIESEPGYEAHPNRFNSDNGWLDQSDVRKSFYWAMFAGAAGYTYGCHCIWQMWQPGRDPINFPVMPWKEALKLPGSTQVGYGRKLLLSRPYLTRQPDQWFLVRDAGSGPDHIRATRCSEASYAMVFLPNGQRVRVRSHRVSGDRLHVWWFNPRDGSARDAGLVEKQDEMEFVPPFDAYGRDWVLALDDPSKGFAPPGTI